MDYVSDTGMNIVDNNKNFKPDVEDFFNNTFKKLSDLRIMVDVFNRISMLTVFTNLALIIDSFSPFINNHIVLDDVLIFMIVVLNVITFYLVFNISKINRLVTPFMTGISTLKLSAMVDLAFTEFTEEHPNVPPEKINMTVTVDPDDVTIKYPQIDITIKNEDDNVSNDN